MHPLMVIPCLIASLAMTRAEARRGQVQIWFEQLGSPDQHARTQAKRELMGLHAEELPMLRQIVAAAAPLRAAQIDPLHEAFDYIYVRHQLQKLPRTTGGFLGLTLPGAFDEPFGNPNREPASGVEVSRLPGFAAYRFLEDGDIIRGISQAGELKPIRTSTELKQIVSALSPGEDVTIHIQRGAADVTVRFPLDAAPVANDVNESLNLFASTQNAQNEAAGFWEEAFLPLILPAP
ncbi:MAG: hypothetical protein H7144_17625 [Burkholderiales bacterium]|nr:hypothetical protein [Phycisphaerae bacterium]